MSNGSEPSGVEQIKRDIRFVVGGDFSPDSSGPEKYNAVLARLHARPGEYLETFERMFLGPNFDALNQSHLFIPDFLEILSEQEPEKVRGTASRLLKQYDSIMVVHDEVADKASLAKLLPDETLRLFQRLNKCRVRLKPLIE